jgi:regulator of replication initiation timing
MQSILHRQIHLKALVTLVLLVLSPTLLKCQSQATSTSSTELAAKLQSLLDSVNQLQSQMQTLNSQMTEMRAAQKQAMLEAEQLRAELSRTRQQLAAKNADASQAPEPNTALLPSSSSLSARENPQESPRSLQQRVSKLEDDQLLMNDKIIEQSQTKVESGSKYRVRLSGIVLLNTRVTRGSVDNLDFPQIATPPDHSGTSGSFSGSLRQSQIGIEAFGPDIAGARTSANIRFDFAGGFPDTGNGSVFGLVRLRTGVIRMDWANTSLIAGQDALFFAPLTPTTLSSLAIPALSYTGNLWSWTPQIRIEHRITLSDSSKVLLQAGILDSLTGNNPPQQFDRYPSVGEQSGQPAYAAHVAYVRQAFGKELILGAGGYYGRQHWAFGRNVDGWVGMTDVTLPLGRLFSLTGEFYRGRAVGGLGGGVGQGIVISGPINDAATSVFGLDSMGGWAQLKFKPKANFEVNFAYGQDNPFASELRAFPATALYYGTLLSRNRSPFLNFVYRVRSDVLFSVEYRHLQTYSLDSGSNKANQIGLNLGYAF